MELSVSKIPGNNQVEHSMSRQYLQIKGVDTITSYLRPIWGIKSIIIAMGMAILATLIFRKISIVQTYSDLVVGYVTVYALNKTRDYYSLLVFLASFFVTLVSLNFAFHIFRNRKSECERITEIPEKVLLKDSLIIFLTALIPAGWWVGGRIVYFLTNKLRPQASYHFLLISASALVIALIIKLMLRRTASMRQGDFVFIAGATFLSAPITYGALLSIALIMDRYFMVSHVSKYFGGFIAYSCIAMVILMLILIRLNAQNIAKLKKVFSKILLWIQLPLPLLLLILVPFSDVTGDVPMVTKTFYVIVWSAILFCFVLWVQRLRAWHLRDDVVGYTPESIVMPSSVIAFLIFMHCSFIYSLPGDDYHLGEWYLPWQQLVVFKNLPYSNINYPHGIVHLIHGFFASVFFEGTAGSFEYANVILIAIALAATFFSLRALLGVFLAFLIMYTFPFLKITSLNMLFIMPSLMLLVHPFLLKKPSLWIFAWIFLSTFSALYAPSTGTAFILGTLPAALWMGIVSLREEKRYFKALMFVIASSFIIVLSFTEVRDMGKGFILFLLENASVNTVANGIPWKASLFGYVQLLWVIIAVVIILLTWREIYKPEHKRRLRVIIFGSSSAFFLLAAIPYSFGRIDQAGMSRPGNLSLWALYLGLPLMISFVDNARFVKYFLLPYSVLWGAIYSFALPNGLLSNNDITLGASGQIPISAVKKLTQAEQAPLPLKGLILSSEQIERISELKHILGILLKPGETYLDLTNHSARYFYLGYKVPALEAAYYNAPATKTQLRILKQLGSSPPPVILIKGDNISFDETTVPLRVNIIYRYFVLSYKPAKFGHYIFLIEPHRMADLMKSARNGMLNSQTQNFSGEKGSDMNREKDLSLLDEAFPAAHFKKIPIAWGASWPSLSSRLVKVADISEEKIMRTKAVVRCEDGSCPSPGDNPSLLINLDGLDITGRKAGYLSLNFRCDHPQIQQNENEIELSWKDKNTGSFDYNTIRFYAQNGRLLVPLDSDHRWLLSESVSALKISLSNQSECKSYVVKDMQFFQRRLFAE
jgi:hypothetical protein